MYCSACGTKSGAGQRYCKSCGARMPDDNPDIKGQVAKIFSLAAVLIGTFGIIGFAVMIKAVLEHGSVDPKYVLAISAVYFGGLFAIEFLLVRHVLKMIGYAKRETPVGAEPPLFKPAVTAQLEEFREPASVVEETTRDLDKVPRDQR